MLLELNISDFAIIEKLNLRLAEGLNALTGETGAGKSIIIDALGTLRGERADPSFVRAGAERARIEGVFEMNDIPGLLALLQEYGLYDDEDETIILTREVIAGSGRSVARINGRTVNSSVLREIGARLVDIHGQHEGLSLFNTRTHIDMLDRYGLLMPLREQVGSQVAALRHVQDELNQLRTAASRRSERIEELQLLLDDLKAAKLRPGEEPELLQERALVQNGARITDLVTTSYALLYAGKEGGKGASRPIVEAMGIVNDSLSELGRLDPLAGKLAEQAAELLYTLEDLAINVRAYRDAMEFDSSRLDAIEDRLTLIRDLQRKHRGSVDDLIERAASAETEIERLTNSAEHMAELEAQETKLRAEVGRLATELSRQRRVVGERLGKAVVESMRDLAMGSVRFQVAIEQIADQHGVPAPLDHAASNGSSPYYAFDKTGIDKVEFMLAPNPGEPLKPLAKIASGGESARLLLALKSILSKVDEVPTLVFDEVDVGVGGRAGGVVGEKLWGISAQHQVICITHLPQVAAFGDSHYAIAKQVLGSVDTGDLRTRTKISRLDDDQRIDEIAAMLDGVPISEHSRRSAQDMLERARQFKERSIHGQFELMND